MVSGHDNLASGQADHCLVGHKYLLHQLFLRGIASASVTQIVLGAGSYALLEVILLQAFYKGYAHCGRQVCVLTIRLLQTVE